MLGKLEVPRISFIAVLLNDVITRDRAFCAGRNLTGVFFCFFLLERPIITVCACINLRPSDKQNSLSSADFERAPLAVDTSRFRHRPLPHLLADRSVGKTAPLPNRGPLKPSKLIPLEVGRHEGDKAKPLPLYTLFPPHPVPPTPQ